MSTLKTDQKVMELLKVTDISRLVAYTSLGELKLQLRKGEKEYNLILDSVPLEKELNSELMKLLFAKEAIPQPNKILETIIKNSLVDINGTSVKNLAVSNEKSPLIIKVPLKKTGKSKKK
jgi:hypothetical protein